MESLNKKFTIIDSVSEILSSIKLLSKSSSSISQSIYIFLISAKFMEINLLI